MGRGEAVKRSTIAVLSALAVVVVIYLLVPSYSAEPMGILLPATSPKTPISVDQVSFYGTLTAPYNYQNLGSINMQYYSRELTSKGETRLKQCVMKMAAQVGANGIIVTLFGHTMLDSTIRSIMSSYIFRGVAICYSTPAI